MYIVYGPRVRPYRVVAGAPWSSCRDAPRDSRAERAAAARPAPAAWRLWRNKSEEQRQYASPRLLIGFPAVLVKDGDYAKALRRCGIQLRQPRGIVVASAHWHTVRPLRVTGSQKPQQLHDYGDYPAWLNAMSYPCPGAPALATRVAALLEAAGTPAMVDPGQGLDFASWMPLSLLYAERQGPIVEVSLRPVATPEDMMALGAPGAAALGWVHDRRHGAVVCNPPPPRHGHTTRPPEGWAREFDEWVNARLQALDFDSLLQYRRQGPQRTCRRRPRSISTRCSSCLAPTSRATAS